MFYKCDKIKDINEFKYLNTKYCKNFSHMFYGCSSAFEKLNVSNTHNFKFTSTRCESLSDIKVLEKWNISNGNNFERMFAFINHYQILNHQKNGMSQKDRILKVCLVIAHHFQILIHQKNGMYQMEKI